MARVDKTLLTEAQRGMYDTWQDFFSHPGWELMLRLLEPHIQSVDGQWEDCVGEQHLGRLQGSSKTFRFILSLPSQIEVEYLGMTGQLDGEVDTDDPVQPADWRA